MSASSILLHCSCASCCPLPTTAFSHSGSSTTRNVSCFHYTCHLLPATCYSAFVFVFINDTTCFLLPLRHLPPAACCLLPATARSCSCSFTTQRASCSRFGTCHPPHATACLVFVFTHDTTCFLLPPQQTLSAPTPTSAWARYPTLYRLLHVLVTLLSVLAWPPHSYLQPLHL
jgi:hypothetical protein